MKKAPFENTPNIEWKNGAWRYRVKPHEMAIYGVSWHKIGVTVADVYTFLADASRRDAGAYEYIATMGNALDKYAAEVLPHKAFATRRINMISITRLKMVFGKSSPQSVTAPDVFTYRNLIGDKHGKKSANNDIEVLGHTFSKLIEWGVIKNWEHPIRGQRIKYSLPSRDRYVTHEEIIESLKVANAMLTVYIPFKLKTGLDKSTILRIELDDITEEGIHYVRGKLNRYDTAKKPKKRIIPLDEELQLLVDAALSLHKRPSTTLFATRDGLPYINDDGECEGFNSVWQRFMTKVLSDTEVEERFTEHDLRAKSASDEEDETIASKRLDHASQATTNRVYRRKAEASGSMGLAGIGLGKLIENVKKSQARRDTKSKK